MDVIQDAGTITADAIIGTAAVEIIAADVETTIGAAVTMAADAAAALAAAADEAESTAQALATVMWLATGMVLMQESPTA